MLDFSFNSLYIVTSSIMIIELAGSAFFTTNFLTAECNKCTNVGLTTDLHSGILSMTILTTKHYYLGGLLIHGAFTVTFT